MNNKSLIRIIAIVLAVLLVGGVVVGALVSALAEEKPSTGGRNQVTLTMEYLEDEQALRVAQRLVYANPSDRRLDAVLFYAAGNMFRRQSALMYDADDLDSLFPFGYAPAGIDLRAVRCDRKPADYGFMGEDELYLRVACDLGPGESCAFEFDYFLLLAACGAFQGAGETDVRLSAFCLTPAAYDVGAGAFALKRPLPFARWLDCDSADYSAELWLPEGWMCAGTGVSRRVQSDGKRALWGTEAEDVRDFALSFGRRWRVSERESASGVRVRALTNVRGAADRVLDTAVQAVEQCEDWFGAFPVRELELIQSDYPLDALSFPGAIWLPEALLGRGNAKALARQLRFCVAQQYFGLTAWVEPGADAWLADSVSQYVACLLLEAAEGRDAFLNDVNRDWVSALQQTVPGGLRVNSDAALFDAYSYDIVILRRGAVVLHELRLAMGLDGFLNGLSEFCRMGRDGVTLTEMDFVAAMDRASGGDWEAFLTDWVFNVDKYTEQTMFWYE